MSRPRICVYTIVKDEAAHIERWVDSARPADHLLMLDTGSTDGTVMLARACGVDTHEAHYSPFRFDDARNAALALIPDDIDIVIQLDADEVFSESNWRRHLDNVPDRESRWSYWLEPHGNAKWGKTTRSNCHRRFGFRWEHPVHEVITGPAPHSTLDLTIIHRPDVNKDRGYMLDLLEAAVNEAPNDARSRFYLGREHWFRGEWGPARFNLWHYLNMPEAGWAPERSEAYILLAHMDSRPERWLWEAVAETPQRREPFLFLALHYEKTGDLTQATSMLQLAGARTDESIYVTDATAWGEAFDVHTERIMNALVASL